MSNQIRTPLVFNAERVAFLQAYKRLARAKQLTAADVVLRARILGKDPSAAFSPVTNVNKLANGAQADLGYTRAVADLRCVRIDKSRELANLGHAQAMQARYPDVPRYASKTAERQAALDAPLELTARWGCNLVADSDYSAGLSLAKFIEARSLAA